MTRSVDVPAACDEQDWPAPTIAWTWVAVLVLAYICSYIDRQILSLMVDHVKADLDITDSQFGMLHGLSFAMLYCVAGLPLGGLVDRYPRRNIIIAGVLAWSVMTALCGASRQFLHLFLARVGVGVGEATLSPSSYSLLADCFDKHRLGLALSVFFAGGGIGAGVAFMLGGSLIAWIDSMMPFSLPLLGAMKTWQVVFLVVALPGLPIALIITALSEPARKGRVAMAVAPSWGSVVAFLAARWRFMVPFLAGISCVAAVSLGGLSWLPASFMRSYGMDAGEVGLLLGIVMIVAIPLGLLSGAWITALLNKLNFRDAALLVATVSSIVMLGAALLMYFANGKTQMTIASFLAMTMAALPIGIAAATLQTMVPNEMRGRSGALLLLCQNGVGMVLGPLIPGLLNDRFLSGNPAGIGTALSITLICFAAGAAIFLAIAYFSLGRPESVASTVG